MPCGPHLDIPPQCDLHRRPAWSLWSRPWVHHWKGRLQQVTKSLGHAIEYFVHWDIDKLYGLFLNLIIYQNNFGSPKSPLMGEILVNLLSLIRSRE